MDTTHTETHGPNESFIMRDLNGRIIAGAGKGTGNGWSWWARSTKGRSIDAASREDAIAMARKAA